MSSKTVFNRIKIFSFLFATIFCLLDEGNIYLPMVSNFTLEHSQNKVNNKNYYTIPLKIGSQGIEFNVQVDTSTSTSWIPSSRCENCVLAQKTYNDVFSNDKRGMLLIGDLPGKQYNTFCNVTTDINDMDDMYKESWICHLTHVGVFETNKGIFNKMKYYSELENNNLVNFDSAYDYIAVPISEKSYIEELLEKANLKCETSKKSEKKEIKNESLRNRIREEEVTITCKTDLNELIKKDLMHIICFTRICL